jgi:antitoxin component YwqK of YwqJK toxin-antitoxin module
MPTGKPKRKPRAKEHIQYHKNGTVWARGQTIDGVPTGYWEWFRVDGTRLRSGTFEAGEQVGEWTTYDKAGEVYKVTTIKRKAK